MRRVALALVAGVAGFVVTTVGVLAWRHFSLPPNLERENEEEEQAAPRDDSYLALRYAWPGQKLDAAWLRAAEAQDRHLAAARPAGKIDTARRGAQVMNLDPNQFTPLGPRPLNDPADGLEYMTSGRVNAIAVDPVNPKVAYLGSDGGGVWKTSNCCTSHTSWQVVTDLPEIASSSIGDIVIDPHDHDVVYATTGDLRFSNWSFGSAGLLRSNDAGATWQLLGLDVFGPFYGPSAGSHPQYQALSKVVVDPASAQHLAVGTKTGLFFSYDAGATWAGPCYTNPYANGPGAQRQDVTALVVAPGGLASVLYAGIGARGDPTATQPDLGNTGANGVYRADWPASGCPSWSLHADQWPAGTGNGIGGGRVGRIELALAPTNSQRLYALAADTIAENGVLGVWRSDDGADTWTQTCNGTDCASADSCDSFGQQMWYDAGLTVDPVNADRLFLSGVDLFRSTDAGASFKNLTCGYASFDATVHVDHHARTFVGGNPERLLIGTDGGVYYTANATASKPDFSPLNLTLSILELYSGDITADFATDAEPGISAGAQDNGSVGRLFDGTPTTSFWGSYPPGGDGTFTQIEPILRKRWYFSTAYGALNVTYGSGGLGGGVAPIGPNWGGGSPTFERKSFLMPFQLYKYGELDVPGSGCTTVNGCTHLVAGTHRLWETVIGGLPGSEWYVRTGDLTKNTLIVDGDNRSYINALSYATSDPSVAVVGTSDGNVQYVFGLGFTLNQNCPPSGVGTACAKAVDVTGNNAVLPLRPVLDVITDPRKPLVAYAALGGFAQNSPGKPGHVYRVRCTAQCAAFSWDDRSGNLPNIPVDSIAVNPRFPSQVFAGTDWGLYYTNDIERLSPVWQRFDGLPRMMIWDMAIDRGFTTLALFTRSRGAWVWPLPDPPDLIFADDFES